MNKRNRIEWKWTKEGEVPERSIRIPVRKSDIREEIDLPSVNDAYTSSLHHDENTWSMMNPNLSIPQRNEKIIIESQQIMSQRNQNPFFVNNNYVDDINKQNDFLKPISTTREK